MIGVPVNPYLRLTPPLRALIVPESLLSGVNLRWIYRPSCNVNGQNRRSFMLADQQSSFTTEQIYKLRYTAYLSNDSIDPNPNAVFYDRYDAAGNCLSHIEYIDGQPAGSIRACVYDPAEPDLPIPAMENYGAEIARVLGPDKKLVEANKYTIHPSFQHRSIRIKALLYGFILDVALKEGADFIIGAIRPSQALFYKRIGLKPVSTVKPSLHMKFDTVLMSGAVEDCERCFNANAHRHRGAA
ncbi:N-acyl amino acid synthase FeeM domain-containing protein [Kordiimonas marina]|uniref:N-acyl amino acid synthase FeeM domain-containing protein n=1 Tax=Kordiimonas marina TaxID=2872312 RepID=UPI001FF650BE|nr:hypothetical protein [Kordiimonas marina]MCJ9429770.1 hypothetical protein [Kordiimonas marina]